MLSMGSSSVNSESLEIVRYQNLHNNKTEEMCTINSHCKRLLLKISATLPANPIFMPMLINPELFTMCNRFSICSSQKVVTGEL